MEPQYPYGLLMPVSMHSAGCWYKMSYLEGSQKIERVEFKLQLCYCSVTAFSLLTVHMHVCSARVYAFVTWRSWPASSIFGSHYAGMDLSWAPWSIPFCSATSLATEMALSAVESLWPVFPCNATCIMTVCMHRAICGQKRASAAYRTSSNKILPSNERLQISVLRPQACPLCLWHSHWRGHTYFWPDALAISCSITHEMQT